MTSCNLSSEDYYIPVDQIYTFQMGSLRLLAQNQGDDDNNDSDINPDDRARVNCYHSPMIKLLPLMVASTPQPTALGEYE